MLHKERFAVAVRAAAALLIICSAGPFIGLLECRRWVVEAKGALGVRKPLSTHISPPQPFDSALASVSYVPPLSSIKNQPL